MTLPNVVIEYYNKLFDFTNNTESILLNNVFLYSVKYLGSSTNDWGKVTTNGCNFRYTVRDELFEGSYIGNYNMKPYRFSESSPIGNLTPRGIGEEVFDKTNNKWYKSTGLLNSNWVELN